MPSVHSGTNGEASQVGPEGAHWNLYNYEKGFKAYRVFDIDAEKVVISRAVNFDESAFNFFYYVIK